ncbi:hypothetical protein GO755_39375 [Spirosoma sp. HMF4905]|uniref:Uncharacterized protein n=1 Tax=Spirosoma arboris TaxID=2682092 RepID=A0A7K1SQW5_9BACT|nr:hypothetical protein [Spirosoma arboris]MVM36140.1 hypothetical protein [Spirosoma arboris]
MSLEIRLNGQAVDLTPGLQVSLELVNPYLVYEDILSSSSTVPALPATNRNRIIMGFPDLLQSDALGMRYDCEKYYNGQLLQSGVAILTESAETFALTVVQPLGELFGDLQTKTLPEIPFGTLALPVVLTPVLQSFGRDVLAFPSILNADFYGSNGGAISYSGMVNNYTAGAYATAGPVVPMPFLKEILLRLAELTGVTLSGQFLDDPDLSQLLLYNTRALDGRTTIDLRQHLPEMSIPVFFLELRKLFNLAMSVDTVDRSIRLDFTDSFHKAATSIDWSKKALKTFKKRPEMARRLQLGSEQDSNDALTKDKPDSLTDYLTPEIDSETTISPLTSKFSTLLTDPATGLAITKQAGITEQFSQLANKFGPRLLFWNGVVNGQPTATASRGNYSLYWKGPQGLAATFWPMTEQNRTRRFYVERSLDLTEVDLARLDFSKKVHINGMDYFIANVAISLPIKSPATVLLLKA